MTQSTATIWLHPSVASPEGCGNCLDSAAGPVCRGPAGPGTCAAPDLEGAPELLQPLMAALNAQVVDSGTGLGLFDLHWVQSLRVADGEAELTVTFPPTCGGGKAMAEAAFDTLRRLLPDTDVYVRHSR